MSEVPKQDIPLDENGKPLSKGALKKLLKQQEKERRKAETAARIAAEKAKKEAEEIDFAKDNYGKLPINQSQSRTDIKVTRVIDLNEELNEKVVNIRGRVQTHRLVSGKLHFVIIRQKNSTVQCVASCNKDTISKQMIKFISTIPVESLVDIEGLVTKTNEEITSCTVSKVELKIKKIFVVSEAIARLPFTLEDASRPEEEYQKEDAQFARVNIDTRLNNRVIDLRTITNHAIFKIQAGVCKIFRDFLDSKDFTEIHTPKIIAAASEGGANVFKIQYFKNDAFLAQSPQFYKQMMICSDYERVYEIGPVFRAENSFTHRHMTEFVGMDMEMTFQEHYHEVLDVFNELFIKLFDTLKTKYAYEISIIKRQYPSEEFEYQPKSVIIKYMEGIEMLRGAGVEIGDFDDLSTENEKLLGKLVKEKYHTDFYMLDKFPLAVRPFYTMPDPNNKGYSNSYDFFMRGEEIMSGAQRIHDADLLLKSAKDHGVDPSTIQGYLDAFKYGAPPHAGGGIGLERIVMLYFGLGNIRRTSLFPRDPKRLEP